MAADRIFKVHLNIWKEYFVMAKSFDSAALKAIEHYEDEKKTSILTNDGSLSPSTDGKIYVKSIEYLGDKLIK